MDYSQKDIPLEIHHGEILSFENGQTLRFESNGEAKDLFFGDEWSPTIQLFPACDYSFENAGDNYKATALFEDGLKVEKI
ncbi:hypothetical protein [Desulfobaculum bizertense]|uniref:Aldose 1-epimerase n=1 Tax=Desulfobaculum bizertense DSM 18034 TaxID=1121442 RepID=A0A1T4WIM3_9BACT|nr:hypothetical protein [Desulfobaculum bizertense]UIJ39394.1 hypothetical protein LWC08_07480 [Desulfobaculum bizertense]SKA76501.1 hypothetical protein SAMN02745702_02247 [Desulfobaculum bizertense DSM 18034]